MAEPTGKTLRVVVVTPEKAVLDEAASQVILPLFDGEKGVQPGHAAFVGQLGPGELRITATAGGAVRRYFIDGGFAQVRANTVNVLTGGAKAAADLTDAILTAERAKADALPAANAAEAATKARATAKVSAMTRVATKRG